MQSFLKLCITLLGFSLLSFATEAQTPEYLYHICSNTTTFTRNSTYQANLNQLLSSLGSNNNGFTSRFYNATVGGGNATVYGHFLCRGDVTSSTCGECVRLATTEVTNTNRCPVEKVAIIWYDFCLLRYSNQSFFSIMDTQPTVYMWNLNNISQPDSFNAILAAAMNNARTEATNTPSRFATRKANFTAFQTLYSLVQCTPDLSRLDCDRCLQGAISQLPTCCNGKQGGRVLSPSCNIRYEIYPFYNENSTAVPPTPAALPPPPPPAVSVPPTGGRNGLSTVTIIAIVAPITASVLLFILGCCFLTRRARKKYHVAAQDETSVQDISSVESLQFDFGTIEAATSGFSDDNRLGGGGFGSVYKGMLPSGQEIAVKRLSKGSGQGVEEFKNEIVLVARLQHRNLVRLLGFCLEGEEKILVYEFVPNKSLDYFLFDPEKQGLLDWSRRYKIVGGIARGILYLHEDSRLRIIHRDLKASNILLDGDMNPKVSDFGMARIFGVDQTQGNTNRIVGTYGYMSPEYAMHGDFSVKSDVFSFGVLILEILTGQKNSSFYQTDGASDLLSYAWKHWRNGTTLELLDPTLRDSYSSNEVIRCVHIALLSVQEDPADRPTMATIVLMFNSYSVTLPVPNEPAFFSHSRTESSIPVNLPESDQSTSKSMPWSVNEASITEVYPR